MIKFSLNESDVRVIASLEVKRDVLLSAVQKKMTFLLLKLQQKIRARLSGPVLKSRTGTLKNSIIVEEARIAGYEVVGDLLWAQGPGWYGRVHEFGGTKMYVINPLGTSGTREHVKGAKTRYGKNVLRFMIGRKVTFSRYVFHPPAVQKPFIAPSVAEMRDEFTEGLREAVIGVLKTK